MSKAEEKKGIGLESQQEDEGQYLLGRNYLLSIAIDEYTEFPHLNNAVADAKALVKVLTKKYQFEQEYVITLYNKQASQQAILVALNELIERVRPQDNVLIFFSGHGEYRNRSREGYWLPYNGSVNNEGSWVSNDAIVNKIRAIKSHHTLAIVDSCFSGSLFAVSRKGSNNPQYDIASRWLITSGRYEEVSDGTAGSHSPFTEGLLYFLTQNEENELSTALLIQKLITATTSNSKQTPRGEPLHSVGHFGGQFFFYLKEYYTATKPTVLVSANAVVPAEDKTIPKAAKGRSPQVILLISSIVLLIAIVVNSANIFPLNPDNKNATSEALDSVNRDSLKIASEVIINNPDTPVTEPPKPLPVKGDSKEVKERPKPLVLPTFDSSDELQEFRGNAADNGLIAAKNNDRWGFVKRQPDSRLKTVIPFEYDLAESFQGGLALVKKDNKFGWIDANGKAMIALKYKNVGIGKDKKWDNVYEGARVMDNSNKWGIIDHSGKLRLKCEYDTIGDFDDENIAVVKQTSGFGFVRRNGQILVGGCIYEDVESPKKGKAQAKLFGGEWKLIDLN